MNPAYCSMIHGGLYLDFKSTGVVKVQHCCLRDQTAQVRTNEPIWTHPSFQPLRDLNKQGTWDPGCQGCNRLEKNNQLSFRTGMNQGLGITGQTDLSGPARIDLMFDISCNLACMTCNSGASTYWQKYLKKHNQWTGPIFSPRSKHEVIAALSTLDLSNLRQLVFCGGETLLGQEYWDVAAWLADNVPNAKQQLTIGFQTNGTQPILSKNFGIIDRVFLVKLHISLDGIDRQFDYLRWPADWNQVVDNILELRASVPSNVMFLVEETLSIFNLYYSERLAHWVQHNFNSNREGDITNHTRHFAKNDYSLANCSREYVEALQQTQNHHLVPNSWQENTLEITNMIAKIKKHDAQRQQSFVETFPELAEFYSRFL